MLGGVKNVSQEKKMVTGCENVFVGDEHKCPADVFSSSEAALLILASLSLKSGAHSQPCRGAGGVSSLMVGVIPSHHILSVSLTLTTPAASILHMSSWTENSRRSSHLCLQGDGIKALQHLNEAQFYRRTTRISLQ